MGYHGKGERRLSKIREKRFRQAVAERKGSVQVPGEWLRELFDEIDALRSEIAELERQRFNAGFPGAVIPPTVEELRAWLREAEAAEGENT